MGVAKKQRTTFLVLLVFGVFYFAIFVLPNSYGARSEEILLDSSGDEYVTYPYVVRILTPGKTFNETRANLFLYEDYHYGYPFYAASALVLLPARLVFGSQWTLHMQLNLLLLRQMINVLPMILAAGVLVFLQTRFLSTIQSLALFVFLLTIRGIVRNHIWWWHPDALAVLLVVLTLFFLDRDNLRFGRNFLFAAVACGLASAIKLLGFFFFLTIPVYIIAGLIQRRLTWKKAVFSSSLFVVVMVAVLVFSNPFLFSDEQRARMFEIQAQKSEELYQGYEHDDPMYYSKGPQWWVSTIEKWYAPPFFILFVAASLAVGIALGQRKLLYILILTWVVPYSFYLLYFVAVKPDHYWLPVFLPLFSCAFTIFDIIPERAANGNQRILLPPFLWGKIAVILAAALLVWQFVFQLARPVSGNIAIYTTAIDRGVAQLQAANP